jgi:Protein of unknown function (DUF3460)
MTKDKLERDLSEGKAHEGPGNMVGTQADSAAAMHPEQQRNRPVAGYVSEFEQFLNQFKAANPEIEEDQRRGWYIWWDHKAATIDKETRRKETVAVKPYPYE